MERLLTQQVHKLREESSLLRAEMRLSIEQSRGAIDDLRRAIRANQSASSLSRAGRYMGRTSIDDAGSNPFTQHPQPDAPRPDIAQQDSGALLEERDWLLSRRKEMLDALAYEVRQPLNNASAALESAQQVMARAEDALEHGKASERLQRAHGVVIQVASALDNTLADAVLLGGTGPACREDMDIGTLLRLVVAEVDHRQRARVQIHHDTTTRTASMDSGLMRLALRNLVANALAYSPAGSPVNISVADCDDPLALQFEVCDQGPGLPAELVPRLFERGAHGLQTRNQLGHGLGLYIVRRVMELHGGSVQASTVDPTGVCMRLLLPQ